MILRMILRVMKHSGVGDIELHKESAEGHEALQKIHDSRESILTLDRRRGELHVESRAGDGALKVELAVGTNYRRRAVAVGAGSRRAVSGEYCARLIAVRNRETPRSPLELTPESADASGEPEGAFRILIVTVAGVLEIAQDALREVVRLVVVTSVICIAVDDILPENFVALPVVTKNLEKLLQRQFFLVIDELLYSIKAVDRVGETADVRGYDMIDRSSVKV